MSQPPTLTSMPAVPLSRILEDLEFRSIISLQKVSRDFCDFIYFIKPNFQLSHLEVHIHADRIQLIIKSPSDRGATVIDYQHAKNGCYVILRNDPVVSKFIEFISFERKFYVDFQRILSQQKSILEEFHLSGVIVPTDLKKIFESSKCLLKARQVFLTTIDESDLMNLLSYTCPKTIEEINIHRYLDGPESTVWSDNDIVDMKHWKNAKTLIVRGFKFDLPISDFVHFQNINVMMAKMTAEDLLYLKDVGINSPPVFPTFRL